MIACIEITFIQPETDFIGTVLKFSACMLLVFS